MKSKVSKVTVPMIIAKALEIFGPTGKHWISGKLADGSGNFCMLGGLNKAGHMLKAEHSLVQDAKIAVAKQCPNWSRPRLERDSSGRFVSGLAAEADNTIPSFNDCGDGWRQTGRWGAWKWDFDPKEHKHFQKVKKVMCKALEQSAEPKKLGR